MRAFFVTKGLWAMGLVAAYGATGCGSDSGSGGVNSGVDPSVPANMASASDAQKVCSAVASYAASNVTTDLFRRTACVTATALGAIGGTAPTVAQCNDSVTKCVANAQTSAQPAQTTSVGCAGGVTLPPNCTATVGEIQSCATAATDATKNFLNGISCDLWGLPPADAQAKIRATPGTPSECTTVQQKCPGLLGATAQTPAPASS